MHLTVAQGGDAHDGAKLCGHRRSTMNPTTRLKLSGAAFAILWTGWMLWWSESFDLANVIIMSICGGVAGYAWYRVMGWQFRRQGLVPRDEQAGGSPERR
jgi:hypothetical protein